MNNKLTIAVAVVAGLAGGMLTRFIAPPPAFAQAPAQTAQGPSDEVRARSFVLVDNRNNPVATFVAGSGRGTESGVVELKDPGGNVIWRAGGSPVRPLNATVR